MESELARRLTETCLKTRLKKWGPQERNLVAGGGGASLEQAGAPCVDNKEAKVTQTPETNTNQVLQVGQKSGRVDAISQEAEGNICNRAHKSDEQTNQMNKAREPERKGIAL